MVKTKQLKSVVLHTHGQWRHRDILSRATFNPVAIDQGVGKRRLSRLCEMYKMMHELFWDRLVLHGEVW